MTLFLISLLAGVLTVLAPCILPLLPVIIGGSITEGENKHKSLVIIGSLVVSLVLFTLLLKWSTAFINIPPEVWQYISGGILILVALTLIFPALWEKLPFTSKLSIGGNKLLGRGYQKKSFWGDVVMGAALGPVFSSCSPTYFVILATVLPQSFAKGIVDLLAYAVGLGVALLVISILGQKIVTKLGVVSDSRGLLKRGIGMLFLIVGIAIFTGLDKRIETSLVAGGKFDFTGIETKLLQKSAGDTNSLQPEALPDSRETGTDTITSTTDASPTNQVSATSTSTTKETYLTKTQKAVKYPRYVEIANPAGFVNTLGAPITIGEHVGKEVILIDFLAYSCINCQRTFPYLKTWYETYHKDGFEIIAIHTPEFAFEKSIDNVTAAMKRFGITFPVVFDNDYGTWNAYKNSFWPHKYLIDIDGYIVYDHIGEGEYDTTEAKIQYLLREREAKLGMSATPALSGPVSTLAPTDVQVGSPETYFGSARNEFLANGMKGVSGIQTLTLPATYEGNKLYLGGTWNFTPEYAEASAGDTIVFKYSAKNVYVVAGNAGAGKIEVLRDGVALGAVAGDDVDKTTNEAMINDERLYTLIKDPVYGQHTITIHVKDAGVQFFTFTFG